MKKIIYLKSLGFVLLIISFFSHLTAVGEGTKEIRPTSSDKGYLVLDNAWSSFALYGAASTSRLNIKICNVGEKIYYGFLQSNNDVEYRIKDPNGNIVVAASILPSSGAGRIGTYAQALLGPSAIAGASGYNAKVYTSTMTGDYYIEFKNVGSRRTFDLFDITVASAANTAIPGRVWSQAWMFSTDSYTNQFKGKLYIYADDGIVTSLNFNGMQPYVFVVSANSTGTQNTGDAIADRKSRSGLSTYPQYKIFLNDPDVSCYSTGSFGALTGPITITGCGLTKCINIPVDTPGNILVLLDLNGIVGYQPGTTDRQYSAAVVAGNNCVTWDTKDGLGNTVPGGTTFRMQIDYLNGITHLPLYDVESHNNGYIVSSVRPIPPGGLNPKLFWDDTNIPNGTTEFTGCSSPCHTWTWGGSDNAAIDYGNRNTINTWWYGNIISSAGNYTIDAVTVDANKNNAPGAANDTTVCTNTGAIQLAGLVSGSTTTGIWTSVSPGGGTFSDNTSLSSTYTLSAAEKTAGLTKLVLTSTGSGSCSSANDTLTIHITPGPTINAGPPQSVCKNNSRVTLAGNSLTVATGVIWSGGGGSYITGNTILAPTYDPSAAEIAAGTATLTLTTTTGNGICPAASSSMTITLTDAPTSNAGNPQTVCANKPAITLAGSVSNVTSQTWSGGAGIFSDASILNPTYTPTPTEISSGSVTLTLTAIKTGCSNVSSTVKITFSGSPTANAGADQSVCANNSEISLSGTVTGATGGTWSGGTGTFGATGASSLVTTYNPSATEKNNGSVILTLTTTGTANNCNDVSDQIKISITPAPSVNADAANSTVCANKLGTTLNGIIITGATGGTWATGCGTFIPNANTVNGVTYTPCASEVSAGIAALIINTTGQGNCAAAKDTVLLIISKAPTVNAGEDKISCANSPAVTLSGSSLNSPSVVSWTGGTGNYVTTNLSPTPQYTPSASEITAGTVTLTFTGSKSQCNSVSDQIVITINPLPTVNAGVDQSVCSNKPAVVLNGSVTVATGGTWSGGNGTFSTNVNDLSATYTPSATEISNGSVTLTLTSTDNNGCTAVTDDMTISFTPAPTVSAGTDQSVCFNNASVTLGGTKTVAAGATWSGGTGSFNPNATTLNAIYTPSAAEKTAGVANLTLTTTDNQNCNQVSSSMKITITGAPTVDAGTDKTVCANNPDVILTGTKTVATGVIWSGGAGTYSPDNTSLTITYTPTVAEILAGSVKLFLTTTGNDNCNSVIDSTTVTITSAPSVDAGSDQTVCGTSKNVSLNGKVTVATGGTWTGGTGNFAPNSPGGTYKPSAADITAGFVDLTLTTTALGSCHNTSDQIRITFAQAPSIFAGPDQKVCTNEYPVQLNATGSNGSWGASSGTISDLTDMNATYTPSAAQELAGFLILTITSNAVVGCGSVSDDLRITILPKPIADAGADKTVCGSITNIPLSGSVSNTTGGFWTTTGNGSFTPDAATVNASYVPTAAERISGATIINTLTTTPNTPCPSEKDAMTLTITPEIIVNAGADQTVCADVNSININGTVTGITTTGTWSVVTGNGTIVTPTSLSTSYTINAADKPGTVKLRLTSSGNGTCPSITDDLTLTITPAPLAHAGADQNICSDSASITLTGTVDLPATAGQWTTNGTGIFSPDAATLNTLYIPSAADRLLSSLTFTLTTTSGNGTCNAVSDVMIVNMAPKPIVSAGSDLTVCADIGTINITGTINNAPGLTWTKSGTGTLNNAGTSTPSYIPSAADITGGTVTLTATSTVSGSCKSVQDQMLITITPAPTVNAGDDQSVCSNAATVLLNGTVKVATGGTWTGGTGTFSDVNSLTSTYTPSPADTLAGSALLTLTTTDNGTCNAVQDQVLISISHKPVVNAGTDITICADSSFVSLSGSISNATGGEWSSTGTGVFFPNKTNLNANYVPSAADKTAGTITLTLTSTGNGSCAAVADTKVITITSAPTANAGANQIICADAASINLSGSFTVAGGGKWTTSGNGSFSDNADPNAVYTPSTNDKNSGAVTLTFTTTDNGSCKSVSAQTLLTIKPIPVVKGGSDITVCADASGASVALTGTVTNATGGTWTTTGSGGFADANAVTTTYFPSSSDKTSGTLTLTLTSTGNGTCNAVHDDVILIITPAPTVNANSDQTICADASGATLNGSVTVTTTGIWSSAGTGSFSPNANALNAKYNPSAADKSAGTVTLKLTTTGNLTCNAVSDDMILTITPKPTADAGANVTACADVEMIPLAGTVTGATGGKWFTSGSGSFSADENDLNATYSPSAADFNDGTVTLTLTTTGIGTCNAVSSNKTITFSPLPSVDAGPDVTACIGAGGISLNPTVVNASGGLWSTNGTGNFTPDDNTLNAIYTPSAADEALPSVTLTIVSNGNGSCNQTTDDLIISFSAAPTISAGNDKAVCQTDLPVQLDGSGAVGTWSGGLGSFSPSANTLNATYIPDATEIGTVVNLTLTRSAAGGCPAGSDDVKITINSGGPTINAGTDINACANTLGVNLAGTYTGATGVIWTTASGTGTFSSTIDNNANFKPSASQITAGVAHLTLTTTGMLGGCKAKSDQVDILIGPNPTIDAGQDQNVCSTTNTINLSASETVATDVTWTLIAPAAGSFDDDQSLSPVYTVNATDKTAGTITLRATTFNNGVNCVAVSDDVVISFTNQPTTTAGGNSSLCADVTSVALSGTVNGATGGDWTTTGTGTFSPSFSTLNANYIPSAADKTGSVTLTLTSTGNGICASGSSARVLSFIAPPTVSAGSDQAFCSDQITTTLTGTKNNAGGILWTSTGTGTFDDATSTGAVYTPSSLDKSNGGANLTITTTGSTPCAEVEDFTTLSISPAPTSSVNAGFDQSLCKDIASVQLNGKITIASGGKWSAVSGTGTFFPNDSTLDAKYIPSSADTAAGTATLKLTTTGNGICDPASDEVTITFTPTPTLSVSTPSTSPCEDAVSIPLNSSVNVATGGVWSSSGSGSFTANQFTLNASYFPTAADIANGSVGLTLTSTGNGTCNAVSKSLTITFTKKPTANAGLDKIVCSNENTFSLSGSRTSATGSTWTTSGTGTFNNASLLNAIYTPSAADKASTRVNLTLTTSKPTCNSATDQVTIDFAPVPTADAGPDQTICADAVSMSLNGTITQASGGVWTTAGSGTFTPSSSGLTASYNPSQEDKDNGTVTLTLTTTGNGSCSAVNDTKIVTIAPQPIVNSGPAVICAYLDGAVLNGVVTNATGGLWSSTGSGIFSPDATTSTATYFPSETDLSSGIVTLTLTSTGNGTCNPVSASSKLLVTVLPVADAGSDQYACKNSFVTLVAKPALNAALYSWSDNLGANIGTEESVNVSVPSNTLVVLEVTDAKGCSTKDTVKLFAYDLPTLALPSHACLSDSLVLDANPTNMPVVPGEFQWYRDNNLLAGENDFTLVVKQTGLHTITWSYNSCSTAASSDVTAPPFLRTVDTVVACVNGSATLTTVSFPSAGISYTWTSGGAAQTSILNPVLAGTNTYYVTATDPLTCYAMDSIKVIGIPAPKSILKDSTVCQGETVLLDGTPLDPTVASMNPTYQWKKDLVLLSETTNTLNINTTTATNNSYVVVVTIDQCSGSDTADILINPVPTNNLPAESQFCPESNKLILNAGAEANLTYEWKDHLGIIVGTNQTDTITTEGTYYLTVNNEFNCPLNDTINVKAVCSPKVFIPTAFSPDGNGNNDELKIYGKYFTNFKFSIFSRWGEIIFYTENFKESWDGTYRGEPMPIGVYPYVLYYDGEGEEFKGTHKESGSITIVR